MLMKEGEGQSSNISDFEKYIEEIIIRRGVDYFYGDCVESLHSEDGLHFIADVDGSELYRVEVVLDVEGNIITSNCDCPYDMGEHCKHEVAVYLAMREYRLNSAQKNIASRKRLKEIVQGMLNTIWLMC